MRYYFAALVIIVLFTDMASAWTPGDIQWAPATSGTLHKGDSLSNGNYTVKVVELTAAVPGIKDAKGNIVPETPVDNPSALIDIYKNGVFMEKTAVSLSGEYIDPDYEVMISATGFTAKNAREWVYEYYNPSVTVGISLRGKPKFDVTVTTDKTKYTSSRDPIIAKVVVKNSGDATARNVDVNLNAGDLQVQGGDITKLHQHYNIFEKGVSQNFYVTLVVPPELFDQPSHSLRADAKGIDVKGVWSNGNGTVSIPVSPDFFSLSKAVRDRMYLNNTAIVTIDIGNHGTYDMYDIHINDSLNANFMLPSNTSLQWDIPVLKPGGVWSTTYSIKPLEANLNGFTIPATTARFTINNKPYTASSNIPNIVVNGPKLIINKTVNKQTVNISEYVIVTLRIKNRGDVGTKFEVNDSLPQGVSIINGSISLANYSDPNSVLEFKYTIRMDKEGKIELPSAVANYTDVGYRGTTKAIVTSEKSVITVIDRSKVTPGQVGAGNSTVKGETSSTPKPTDPQAASTPMTPGFGIGFAIVVLVVVAAIKRR